MRSVWFALVVAVALGVVGVRANADTVDSITGGTTVEAAVPHDSQVDRLESDKSEKDRIHISVNYYTFIPSDGETRTNFGKVWSSFGIGRFRPERPKEWAFDWDVTFWAQDGASEVLLIPLTVGVQRGLSQNPDRQSYLAARVGPYYGKVEDNLKGPDDSKFGVNANLALGMVINQRYVVEARYDWFTKIAGNDLNGLTLTAGVKVFDFSL